MTAPLRDESTDVAAARLDERQRAFEALMSERLAALDKALQLQAEEYERRLENLNGEYQRDRQRQQGYVAQDKYDDARKSDATAREAALQRIDEKFTEHVKRYELRQREVDLIIAANKGAAEEAKRATEQAAADARRVIERATRIQNRNLALASLALGLFVAVANFAPRLT